MKRNHSDTTKTGHLVRPPLWNESPPVNASETSDNEDEAPPPARKILRKLLESEVQKAMRELNEEIPTVTTKIEYRAASLIPEFDPDSEECTAASAWLKKIDQLGEIHGWSETTKSFYLQDKLRGQARKWYNRLDEYDYSWEDWKQMLIRAFPRHRDFGNMLEEMMNRKKLPAESMTKYYQDKVAMCFRCKLSDSATVSCVIRGLPFSLQANARAYQCERPEDLYEGFLCALDDYQTPSISIKTRASIKDGNNRQVNDKPVDPNVVPCPRCKVTGHVGFQKCMNLIKKDYWFPKMTRFIQKYVAACLYCAYGKGHHGKKEGKLFPIPKPTEPMLMVHVDHLGPFCKTVKGYQYILVITDAFSKFVIAEPTRTVNSVETIRTLRKIFSLFGFPDKLVSDHGKAFTSRHFKQFSTDKQFRHILTSVACPRANGQVERTNRTILNALRASDPGEAANNWANCLPDIIWGINNTPNESTTYKPYDLMFSKSSRSRCDVNTDDSVTESVKVRRNKASSQLTIASGRMKRNFDKKRKVSHIYKKGDLVLWRQAPTSSATRVNTKLDDIYSGPYVITKVVANDRYRIRSIKGLRGYKAFTCLVAADSLRPYHSTVPISDSASSSDEQLETEDLIDLLES